MTRMFTWLRRSLVYFWMVKIAAVSLWSCCLAPACPGSGSYRRTRGVTGAKRTFVQPSESGGTAYNSELGTVWSDAIS